MTTIFFGAPRATRDDPQGSTRQGARPVAPVCCSAIVVCHLADRHRMTKS